MYSIQPPLPGEDFFALPDNDRLVMVLSTLELGPLLSCLGEGRVGAGRRGFGARPLLYALIAAWVYELHSIAHLRRELLRNPSLRVLCGLSGKAVPSEDAFGRLIARLAKNVGAVETVFARLRERICALDPELGAHLAIDSTAIHAWSDGNRSTPSDPDAAWGKKGVSAKGRMGWWFGYKVHLAVDTTAELPLAYTVTPANVGDGTELETLVKVVEKSQPEVLAAVMADAAYDGEHNYQVVWETGALPVIDFNSRGYELRPGFSEAHCPLCECGQEMRYLGRDRVYVKYERGPQCSCPEGPAITRWRIEDDIRWHPPLPRHTLKWQRLYRERTSVERVNARLKGHLRLDGLRHRGLDKVKVHVGLSLIVQLAGALAMMEAGNLRCARSIVRLVA